MVDDKLARHEAERAANSEAIKRDIKSEVGAEVNSEAARPQALQARRVEALADGMRRQAVDEVVETGREVRSARSTARISQIVDYLFFLIYGLLTIRLLLELFAARENAGFFSLSKPSQARFIHHFAGWCRVRRPLTALHLRCRYRRNSRLYAAAPRGQRLAASIYASQDDCISV